MVCVSTAAVWRGYFKPGYDVPKKHTEWKSMEGKETRAVLLACIVVCAVVLSHDSICKSGIRVSVGSTVAAESYLARQRLFLLIM